MRFLSILMILAIISNVVFAQQKNCSSTAKKRAQQKGTVASAEEYDYDITGLKFNLNLSNTATTVSGDVTTYATTTVNTFTTYAFELNPVLTIDSVIVNNETYTTITTNGSARKVSLVVSYPVNTKITAQVFYHGTAPAGNGQFFTGGLNKVTLSSGSQLVYSLSDDLFADDWWPCKQSLQDKIDSVIMWVTVDDSLRVAANGTLQQVTSLPANKHRYEWTTYYPIEYYLIAVAVGPYKEYNYYMHFTDGTNDSMLVQNFIADSSSFLTNTRKLIIDSTGLMIDHFSKLFGRYPFDDEKYGHAMTTLSGGMEHQTMTFMSIQNLRTTLVAHELGHQWWGNSVTYGKWEDIWLSEGMATYTEQLYIEKYWGAANAAATRNNVFNIVMSQSSGSVWVDDTTNVNRIFDGRLTYNKGAAVAHMLRYMAPVDSLFFKALRAYQQQYKYGTAVTTDFKNVMEQAYNISLDSFFRQWIYGEGYPTYSAKWAEGGNTKHIKIEQTTSDNSVAAFSMPVEVRVSSAAGDTTVKVNLNGKTAHFIFLWDKTITSATIDPDNHIVNRVGKVEKDNSILSIESILNTTVVIYPNPAKDGWHITQLDKPATLKLYNINGSCVWQGNANSNTYIPAQNLVSGYYLLQVKSHGAQASFYKLLK